LSLFSLRKAAPRAFAPLFSHSNLRQSLGTFMQVQQVDIAFEKFTLSNGLTVIVHEDHKAPIVALNVWYHVGSKNEKAGKTGFAHLFEHLMFGGSEHLRGQYIEAMEGIGATDLNGTTNEDRTNYFENVPTSALDFALFAESDRMGHFYNTISQEVLDLQRGVVQNEKRQGDNQPYAVAEDLIVRATYPSHHPYAHTVIGSMEDLDSASVEDVRNWFKTYYSPSNAVLVIAGDITVAEAKEKVTKYFGDIPPGPPIAHQQAWIAKMSGEHREIVQDRVPLARIYKVWNVPQYGSAEAAYLNLASSVLSSGKSSRLHKRLVFDDQIATSVVSYMDAREISGQFVIVATAKPGQNLEQIEKALDEELARFLAEGPTELELERVKTQYEAGFVRGLERIGGFGGKSDILARSQTFMGVPDGFKQSLERIRNATAAQIRETAQRWLSDGVYVLSVVPYPPLKAEQPAVTREELPALSEQAEPQFPALHRATLSNGLKVILAERHEIPVVNFWLQVEAGYAADNNAIPGVARLAASLLTSGTKTRKTLEISDEIQLLGAQISTGSSLDFTTVYLSALKAKLDESLHLYADIVQNPVFPESDFARQQSLQLAAIENEKATPVQMALRVLPPLLYGEGHPYSLPLTGSGTTESVRKIDREQVVRFHETWFKPNNATLVIVGDTTLEEMKPKLEMLFAEWKPGNIPSPAIPAVEGPKKPAVYLIDKPGAQQSVIMAGSVAPSVDPSTEVALEAVNNTFGGTFSARLNMNLREDKHWTYGASTVLYGARAQRPYLAVTSVQGDKTKEAVAEILREFNDLVTIMPVSDEELARVKAQTILELSGSRETMNSIGGAISDLIEFNLPDDYWNTYPGRVQALSAAEVHRAAATLVRPTEIIWVLVGDQSSIEESIRSLPLGDIIHLDADGKRI
jgi:zinc protease